VKGECSTPGINIVQEKRAAREDNTFALANPQETEEFWRQSTQIHPRMFVRCFRTCAAE
jgi:hypothetical protein